ncbi:MAG: hypothetical protein M3159_03190 [Actinomycetota bacterium]|nr:hypothetical protein [Actinomycetota bacterium]
MATEENELDELHSQMQRLVGAGPAATLMRHLSPAPWPDVATKADLGDLATKADLEATKADVGEIRTDIGEIRTDIGEIRTDIVRLDTAMQVGFANLESSLIQRMNTQTITMIFALVAVVASISSVALFR